MAGHVPVTQKNTTIGENDCLQYGVSAMQGWRNGMEDAHSTILDLDANAHFFAVYDGHGGREVAQFCARHLHKGLVESKHYASGNIKMALQDSFLRMDELMATEEASRELDELAGCIDSSRNSCSSYDQDSPVAGSSELEAFRGPLFTGTTAVVAVVAGKELYVANAGDSRCVLSQQGIARELSKDHKPDNQNEKERICNAGGFVANKRVGGMLGLSRAIGDMAFKQNPELTPRAQMVTAFPEVRSIALDAGDEFMVLACDGIWDVMTSQQVIDFCRARLRYKDASLMRICEELLDTCLAPDRRQGIGCDNMSAAIVVFKQYHAGALFAESPKAAAAPPVDGPFAAAAGVENGGPDHGDEGKGAAEGGSLEEGGDPSLPPADAS
eukprot:jgi/Mesvir1/13163/Mv06128-RA.1